MTTKPSFPPHQVDQLRLRCQQESTRTFNARGVLLKRCPQCMLGEATCICPWRTPGHCNIEFVLLMHRDEIFKPTNTGRLIADLFPGQCHAFLWDRTRPPPQLLSLLQEPHRHCVMLFPPTDGEDRAVVTPSKTTTADKTLTVIVPDGTWKQARKMAKHSSWMQALPLMDLSTIMAQTGLTTGNYRVRQACDASRLSTAEAVALVLEAVGDTSACRRLLDYFDVFNEHYVCTRMNRIPQQLEAHERLQSR